MPYQNISASLSETDVQEIKAALETIEQKLPFLITLSTEERRKLFKMDLKALLLSTIVLLLPNPTATFSLLVLT
jgi:hypothetical protein